jgi:probable rRNA maturation factor
MEIEMSFENETSLDTFKEEYFLNIAKTVFKHLSLDGYFIFEINLVSKERIHQINKDYRHIDRPTDVISFAFEDDFEGESKINENKDLPRDLGEIFICTDVCIAQAEEYHHSLEREMSFLTCHGLLHLLGYDHMKKEDEEVMFKIQDEVMELLGL